MARRVRWLYWLVPAAMLAVATWGFWPRPLAVEAAVAAAQQVVVAFSEEGRTRLRERFVVDAPIAGTVRRVVVETGDRIAAGAVLATLHPSAAPLLDAVQANAAQARLRIAEESLVAARAELAAAEVRRERGAADLRRGLALEQRGLVAAAQLETLRVEAALAEATHAAAVSRTAAAAAERDAAAAAVRLAGTVLRSATLEIAAPISGTLTRRAVESEGVVHAGQALFELGDLASLEVVSDILTADALRIAPGTPVRLRHGGDGSVVDGVVRRIEPGAFTKVSALGIEEQRAVAVIDFVSAPPAALGDGFRVDVEFLAQVVDAPTAVPTAALVRDGDDWAVFAIEDGRAVLHHVRVGAMGDGWAQVLDGLVAGTVVVVYPAQALRPGTRVRAEG